MNADSLPPGRGVSFRVLLAGTSLVSPSLCGTMNVPMRAEGEIMKTVGVLVTVLILVGCALPVGAQTVVVGSQTVVTTPSRNSGEGWTWDSGRSIVTLYDAGRQFRVL